MLTAHLTNAYCTEPPHACMPVVTPPQGLGGRAEVLEPAVAVGSQEWLAGMVSACHVVCRLSEPQCFMFMTTLTLARKGLVRRGARRILWFWVEVALRLGGLGAYDRGALNSR